MKIIRRTIEAAVRPVLPVLVLTAILVAPAGPAPAEPFSAAAEEAPRLSVMLVEMGPVTDWLGEYYPPGASADFMPWHSYIEVRAQVLDHLHGPAYSTFSPMVYVAHAAYIPGARLLVIAEPRRNGRGLFVRWYATANSNGEYCAPPETIDELRVRPAFVDAQFRREDGYELRCFQESDPWLLARFASR